jgi:PadR family transcriptional regulator, regulatory protein PadR
MTVERLGAFEELVLLAVTSLKGEGYGVTIQEELESGTGDAVSVGAVYATLDRLERKGLVASRVGGATRERGGRRKRFFRVTAAGLRALTAMRRVRSRIWTVADAPEPA